MPSKSISHYVNASLAQDAFFDGLDAYELLEWAAGLSQMALDERNAELDKPLDLSILQTDEIQLPY